MNGIWFVPHIPETTGMSFDPLTRRWCPHCSALLLHTAPDDWECRQCGRTIVVRFMGGKHWLLTGDQSAAILSSWPSTGSPHLAS